MIEKVKVKGDEIHIYYSKQKFETIPLNDMEPIDYCSTFFLVLDGLCFRTFDEKFDNKY